MYGESCLINLVEDGSEISWEIFGWFVSRGWKEGSRGYLPNGEED